MVMVTTIYGWAEREPSPVRSIATTADHPPFGRVVSEERASGEGSSSLGFPMECFSPRAIALTFATSGQRMPSPAAPTLPKGG